MDTAAPASLADVSQIATSTESCSYVGPIQKGGVSLADSIETGPSAFARAHQTQPAPQPHNSMDTCNRVNKFLPALQPVLSVAEDGTNRSISSPVNSGMPEAPGHQSGLFVRTYVCVS